MTFIVLLRFFNDLESLQKHVVLIEEMTVRKKNKNFLHISSVLGSHRKTPWQRKLHRYEIWNKWEDIVGPLIAENSQPASWRNSTLVVLAANHAWVQELQFLKTEILEKIRKAMPNLKISNIRFETGNRNKFAEEKKDRPSPTPLSVEKLSKDERKFAKNISLEIQDTNTQKTIRELIEKDLALKKRCSK